MQDANGVVRECHNPIELDHSCPLVGRLTHLMIQMRQQRRRVGSGRRLLLLLFVVIVVIVPFVLV